MTRRTYKRPPIVEAIFEVRFKRIEWDFSKPVRFRDDIRISKSYAGPVRTQKSLNTSIRAQHDKQAEHLSLDLALNRLQFPSEDDSWLLSVGPTLLSLSAIGPYPGWEAVQERLSQILPAFVEHFGEPEIERLGVRYINRIDFGEEVNPAELVSVGALHPSGLPSKIAEYFYRQEHEIEDFPGRLILMFGIGEPVKPGVKSFLLDIDVVSIIGDGSTVKWDDIFQLLANIRAYERSVFEKLITDKAREHFDA